VTSRSQPRHILIVRTDRIGDVVLSTPVISVLHEAFPEAKLSFLTGPITEPVLRHHPHLKEVIIYDKDKAHKSWFQTLRFGLGLAKKKYDLALILHTTNRVVWLTKLAGIKKRLGYDRRLSWLLTHPVPYIKSQGKMHEVAYNFELLKKLGIDQVTYDLFWKVTDREEKEIKQNLLSIGLGDGKPFVVVHPGASNAKKRWPMDRFIEICQRLSSEGEGEGEEKRRKVVLVASREQTKYTQDLKRKCNENVYDCGGLFDLRQLAALFKQAQFVVSSDSGPVHIASAVGTPVISILGEKHPSLGAKRWGPVGTRDISVYKEVDPADCPGDLENMDAVTIDQVWSAINKLEAQNV